MIPPGPTRCVAVSLTAFLAVVAAPATSQASNAQPDGQPTTGAAASAAASSSSARIRLRVTGELLDRPAPITVRGVRGPARGYRSVVEIRDTRTLRNLPRGRYRLKAGLILTTSDPNTNPLFAPFSRTSAAAVPVKRVTVGKGDSPSVTFHYPAPPRFPRNFRGEGRYIVRDLGFDVPFTWDAEDGDIQMVAGGWKHPIYFTNVVKDGILYTKTYKWPGVGKGVCIPTGPWDRQFFNDWFATSRYVGRATIDGKQQRKVNHFRAGIVFSLNPDPGDFDRIPFASADIFVDRKDSRIFWNVQHFGIQNKLDPQLDEWIQMDSFTRKPGRLDPPGDCEPT